MSDLTPPCADGYMRSQRLREAEPEQEEDEVEAEH